MFEDLIKEMSTLQRTSISVPIDTDSKGYIDKQCPSEECELVQGTRHYPNQLLSTPDDLFGTTVTYNGGIVTRRGLGVSSMGKGLSSGGYLLYNTPI